MMAATLLLAAASAPLLAGRATPPPHIALVLGDDVGWASAGFTGSGAAPTFTPRLDALARRGVVLGRFYGFHYCSPSRSSLLSGRLPVHVFDGPPTMQLNVANPADPDAGQYGIPVSMSTLATRLAQTHEAHTVGKWDVGHARPSMVATGRGFRTSCGYLGGENDYWSAVGCPYSGCCTGGHSKLQGKYVLDFWNTSGPANRSLVALDCNGEVSCPAASDFLESQFLARAQALIASYAAAASPAGKRLLMYYAA